MENNLTFADLLDNISNQIDQKGLSSGLISFCIKLPDLDLLDIYSSLFDKYNFSVFWEENPKASLIAFDKCKSLEFSGPKKFEIAKKFNDDIFKNLVNLNICSNTNASPKIFYFFSFADNCLNKNTTNLVPSIEAVLPRLLITNKGNNLSLRMNAAINNKVSLRENLDEFWSIRKTIIRQINKKYTPNRSGLKMHDFEKSFNASYKNLKHNISNGIELINDGVLEKVVLSSKLIFNYRGVFNLINILKKLRINQKNTCRYVWHRNSQDITFGASPEKLFTLNENIITLEAIAGTSKSNINKIKLLNSEKNLREHEFVINYLINTLKFLKIKNIYKDKLQVISFGDIAHLCTSVTADIDYLCPFQLLNSLHPSPAVCGYPKDEALNCINIIESFDRGNYASPIGWVDHNGNADFRVALRGGRIIQNQIELIAGSGLVKGSVCEEEIDEIKLKLKSLAKEIFYQDSLNNL